MEPPFRFGLERVRELRAHDEERAKEQFAADLNQRLRGEAMLRAAEERLQDARTGAQPVEDAPVTAAALLARQAWVERLERTRADAALNLQGLDARLEASRSSLTDASRRREVLERLKQRQREAHRREANRREAMDLDEIALRTHVRRAAA
ncbi:MAG: flagellar export protein FliJ [Solirubrobacterales bacterium]|nr:flagellar export protein FliJ [Solirubrobacterales bacterium]